MSKHAEMERTKRKSKKDKPNKYVENEISSSFRVDVKTLKENLKINEILRTVKMNSSMRVKAPRGSKVMHNKDFNDAEDIFEDAISSKDQDEEPLSATNTVLNTKTHGHLDPEAGNIVPNEHSLSSEVDSNTDESEISESDKTDLDTSYTHKSKNLSKALEDCAKDQNGTPSSPAVLAAKVGARPGDRKLSLDNAMLSRREGLSQSDVDLNSIGKLPLERKSSFFRKKMRSFLKNTTEVFKRQSFNIKATKSPLTQRRGSVCSRMSVSLQSLNENAAFYGDQDAIDKIICPEQQCSLTSLRSFAISTQSNSTVSVNVSDRPPDPSEEESLAGSQSFADTTSISINSLNESYTPLLNTRAISMSSGLDTANGQRRRKTSRSNRVTWLASESLTDYFRRLIQDEKSQKLEECQSYQDFLSIPENTPVGARIDTKARRLSYARAVSGEDPVLPSKCQDSSFRRKKIPENEVIAPPEIQSYLNIFEKNGIPELGAYTPSQICKEAETLLELDSPEAIEEYLELGPEITTGLSLEDEMQQEIIKELMYTEAAYIDHLKVIVKVYIATAHALQSCGVLLQLNTSTLFAHIPDVLNANVKFWEKTAFPTLENAKRNKSLFNPSLLIPGLHEFAEVFTCYYDFMQSLKTAMSYAKSMKSDAEYCKYITWCNQHTTNRLEFEDMLAKPMQRLTKYHLLISRLAQNVTHDEIKQELELLAYNIKSFGLSVNRSVRQREDYMDLEALQIEPYEPNFKGNNDLEASYRKFNKFNLLLPMVDCGPYINRCVVYEGVLHYRDFLKEFDSHVILFTDMILICKKFQKKKDLCWKMLRPKILLHRTIQNHKKSMSSLDIPTLNYVELDEQGCSKGAFQLSEPKENSSGKTLKDWEHLLCEAIMTYTLTKWYYKYPVRDLAIIERSYIDENYKKENPDICKVEENARLRVAATFHAKPPPDCTRDVEIHMSAIDRERGPPHLHSIFESGMKNFNARQNRSLSLHHQSTTSRSSHHRSSSEQPSRSGASRDDCYSVSLQRSGSSMEHNWPSWFFDDLHSPSITVNVVDEKNSIPSPPTVVLQQPSPHLSPGPRSASACGGSEGYTESLRVTPAHGILHSLPNIHTEVYSKPEPKIVTHTASEKLYRSHQQMIQRNQLASSQHYLRPESRGSSYPPQSPTRGSLKRGLAFSYSFNLNPPLTRGLKAHSVLDIPMPDKPRRLLVGNSPSQADLQLICKDRALQRSPSPGTYQDGSMPSSSADKPEKKKSLFLRRTKESARSASSELRTAEHSDNAGLATENDQRICNSASSQIHQYPSIMINEDLITSRTSLLLVGNSPSQADLQLICKDVPLQRSPSPGTYQDGSVPSSSAVKPEKKKPLFLRRTKESIRSASSEQSTSEDSDNSEFDTEDRRRLTSSHGEREKYTVESCILKDQDNTEDQEHTAGQEQSHSEASNQAASKIPANMDEEKP